MNAKLLLTVVAWMYFQATCLAQETNVAESLAYAASARAESFVSGKIDYKYTISNDKVTNYVHNLFSFDGSSWKLANLEAEHNAFINHKGKSIEITNVKQADGTYRSSARIAPPKSFDSQQPCPPFFAGTLWFKSTGSWIRENAKKAKFIRDENYQGIDVKIIEWELSRSEIPKALVTVTTLTISAGKLRLYVAPSLGFALPRIEYLTLDGKPGIIFETSSFSKYADDVYLPNKFSRQDFGPKGKMSLHVYEVVSYKLVNLTLPDEEFSESLLNGTSIVDGRSGMAFTVGDKMTPNIADIDDIVRNYRKKRMPNWATISLAIVVGCVIGVILFVFWSRLKRRSIPIDIKRR